MPTLISVNDKGEITEEVSFNDDYDLMRFLYEQQTKWVFLDEFQQTHEIRRMSK